MYLDLSANLIQQSYGAVCWDYSAHHCLLSSNILSMYMLAASPIGDIGSESVLATFWYNSGSSELLVGTVRSFEPGKAHASCYFHTGFCRPLLFDAASGI